MRTARFVTWSPTLVLTAHGSADPRSPAVTHAVAGRIRRLRPELDVRVAFCEQNAPNLRDVLVSLDRPAVVSPLLLADAFHARVDIPEMIDAAGADVLQAPVLGEDPALLTVLRQRLSEAGVSGDDDEIGVMVVSVGSSNDLANARTATVAKMLLAGTRWAGARTAFAAGPNPNLAEVALRLRTAGARRVVIAPWFLAHGRITDRILDYAAGQGITVAEPLGSHNLVAATVLDRYDAALDQRVAA
ncbi:MULTISPECIES: sirohydrochlorin chelatase [Mycolicibacterium]|uniref:Cobalamin (Vitamin B12) biosynthesis CbiX protein n=1 Tax=Mycolicibacterium chitae TaxID=1792 RepID=A0A448I489_MYCCI|nr:sirohydrochlorin chelatase [Mycolicibacterium chitae]MCV7106535.1 sirohydrochlorin chelatase [Mycolicibacterium chitae]VEG47367.1 cobalamin (vitamin B12) biosynthesis CbiX protein [Mycolicibacterium chitae]